MPSKKQIIKHHNLTKKYGDKFCAAPFTSVYEGQHGKISVCCQQTGHPIGDLATDNYTSAVNSEKAKKMRVLFLKNQWPDECESCYSQEKKGIASGIRMFMNEKGMDTIDEVVDNMDEDGTIKDQKPTWLDLMWTNKCNFGCLGCTPDLSSTIATNFKEEFAVLQDQHITKYFPEANGEWNNPTSQKIDYILKHADTIKTLHINGGEPFMSEGFFDLLDELIKRKLTKKIKIWTHTNGSIVKTFRGKDLIHDYLVHWGDNAKITMSIDGLGSKGNYIRYGFVQEKWEDTFEKIADAKIKINTKTCANIFNSLHLTEIGERLFEINQKYNVNIIYGELAYWWDNTTRISNVNVSKATQQACKQQLEQIINARFIPEGWKSDAESVLQLVKKDTPYKSKVNALLEGIECLDKKRKITFQDTFPELQAWREDAYNFVKN
jgi:organic radical activating enzyme